MNTCLFANELDDFASAVYRKRWNDGTLLQRDIRQVTADDVCRRGVPDVICGGFPCQDVSVAGKRAGITGERSGLWKEMFRLVCDIQPRYVCVENVPGLLSGGMGVVLGDLATVGYDAEWEVLPASAFGAPHRRDRVFLVAYSQRQQVQCQLFRPRGLGRQQGQSVADGEEAARPENRQTGNDNASRLYQVATHAEEQGLEGRDTEGYSCADGRLAEYSIWNRGWLEVATGFCGVDDGLPVSLDGLELSRSRHRVERLKALGNAIVPQVAQFVGECIMAHNGGEFTFAELFAGIGGFRLGFERARGL